MFDIWDFFGDLVDIWIHASGIWGGILARILRNGAGVMGMGGRLE